MMPLLQKCAAIADGRLPKAIGPQTHTVIDYALAASFFVAAGIYWRRNRRAAIGSLVCGSAAALNSALTDYPGGIRKLMSFRTHGKLDAGLAALTATMPRLMDFAADSESQFFTIQSMLTTAVTAATDYECYGDDGALRGTGRQDEEQIA